VLGEVEQHAEPVRIDREVFFGDWLDRTRLPLTAWRRANVEGLLTRIEDDDALSATLRHVAYLLATIRWETGHTFAPCKEKLINSSTQPTLAARQNRYWKTGFYGRGYVQITWLANYQRAGRELAGMRLDGREINEQTFAREPDLVLEPEVAYAIASAGMREGWFTGKCLDDYIDDERTDYRSARRIINGLDHAEDVAGFAVQFELLLRAAA
jgi:putative chitinase